MYQEQEQGPGGSRLGSQEGVPTGAPPPRNILTAGRMRGSSWGTCDGGGVPTIATCDGGGVPTIATRDGGGSQGREGSSAITPRGHSRGCFSRAPPAPRIPRGVLPQPPCQDLGKFCKTPRSFFYTSMEKLRKCNTHLIRTPGRMYEEGDSHKRTSSWDHLMGGSARGKPRGAA